ncbi:MAG TPA: ester cyclase [Solirubrobacterales bacterium]|nr:ester cyclase [Solirubrobacterales bacterium]
MSAEENETVFRRWIDAFNDRDKHAEADARAPGYVAHAPGVPEPLDADAWAEFIFDVFVGAFPDLRLTIEEIGCSNNTVAARMAFRGTHRGEFQGLPPTNRPVTFRSVELNRMVDGKVAEHWFEFDQVGLLQQLGLAVIPGPRLLPRIVAHQASKLRQRLSGLR